MDVPFFPPELYDTVVNHFRDDIPTLKNVALVDRASAKMCQAHIFRQVTLRTRRMQSPADASQCSKLLDILRTSPHLATRIKELTLDNRESGLEDYPFVSFVADDDLLPVILDILPHITCLKLLLGASSRIWSQMSPVFKSSVEKTLESGNLRNITVLGLHDVPLSLFRGSNRLNHLCLLDTTIVPDFDSDARDQHRCRLATLDLIVDNPRQLIDVPSPFDFTHLQRISISIGLAFRQRLRSLTTLLEANSRTLEYLGLHIFESPPSPQAIKIGGLTSLRYLLIDIPTWLDDDMISYMVQLLQQLTTSRTLETITILIIISQECTLHDWENSAKWQLLDNVFSGLTSPSLVEVKFQVHSNESRLEDITGLDIIERGLPRLSSRGILSVEKIPDLPPPYIN